MVSELYDDYHDPNKFSEVSVDSQSDSPTSTPLYIFEHRETIFDSKMFLYYVFGDGWALTFFTSFDKKQQADLESQIIQDCRHLAQSIQVIP